MKQKKEKTKSRLLLLMAFLLMSAFEVYAQDIVIQGNVKDETSEPIIGASIMVQGNATIGTITDLDGNFTLSIPNTIKQLVVNFVGMQPQTVNIVAGQPLNVTLKSNLEELDEVVVIGYQTMKRKDLTGSVASISGNSITAAPVANVAQSLQGKLPGVNVSSQDGRPDAAVSIRIRGGGSISQSNDPLILVDGVSVNSLNDISADQVERVDVLKDASSTAIYGARGANGVILITTKGAKDGKISIGYSGYVKFNTPTKYLESLSPYDYLKYVWANAAANGDSYKTPFEKLYGLGANSGNNKGGIESYRDLETDDIQRDVYNSSVSHNHDLSISGGTDKTKVMFSMNYMDDQGMKTNSYSKRANVSLKVNQKLSNTVDVNIDARYTDAQNMGSEGTTSGNGSLLSSAYRFRPIATSNILGDLNALRLGNMEQYGKQSSWDTYSPASRIADYEPLTVRQSLRGTASLNWRIIKGLTYHTDLSMGRSWSQNKTWGGAIYNNYIDDKTGEKLYAGSIDYKRADGWDIRWTNTLNWEFNFGDSHKFNILAGQEISNKTSNYMKITADHFPSNFTKDYAFGMINQYDPKKGTSSFSTYIDTPERISSIFGRINYTLLDRYLFTLTTRYDGSSNFSPEHQWGNFFAGAAAWRLSDEAFIKDINWIDNLKLRLSYGEVGNDRINANSWEQKWKSMDDMRWQYVINNQYQATYDYESPYLENKNLKWETTVTRNFGVDFAFFKNRIWGTVDAYWNTTKDLLMITSLPGISGFTSTTANIGQTSNKGLELSLSGLIFKNKDWDITAGANINFNKGKVDELAENITGLYGTSWASTSTYPNADYILKEGSPVGLVRGLQYDGFYTTDDFNYANGVYTLKAGVADIGSFIGPVHGIGTNERPKGQIAYPGIVKYKDLDGSGTIDDKDVDVIGDMTPAHTGGFNINATYKNFDMGAYFNWSYGNEVYNVNKLASIYGYKETGVYENKLSMMNNSYKIYDIVNGQLVRLTTPDQLNAANTNASLPLAYNENGVTSSLGIEDGSYLRLNTLTVGYTLPKRLVQKARISNLRFYGSVYNLLTITGYSGLDPEVNANSGQNKSIYPTVGLDWGTYPRARSFVVGVNLSF